MEPGSCWITLEEPSGPYRGCVCPFSPCCWLQVLPFSYQDVALCKPWHSQVPGDYSLPRAVCAPSTELGTKGDRAGQGGHASAQEPRYQPRAKAAGCQRDVSPAGMVTP